MRVGGHGIVGRMGARYSFILHSIVIESEWCHSAVLSRICSVLYIHISPLGLVSFPSVVLPCYVYTCVCVRVCFFFFFYNTYNAANTQRIPFTFPLPMNQKKKRKKKQQANKRIYTRGERNGVNRIGHANLTNRCNVSEKSVKYV